jgi:hypothetical protein
VLKRLALRKRWTPAQWAQLLDLLEKCGGFESARARALELADEAKGLLGRGTPTDGAPRGERASSAPSGVTRAVRRALERAVDYAVLRES